MAQNPSKPLKDAFPATHDPAAEQLREQLEVIEHALWLQMGVYGVSEAYAFLADGSPHYDDALRDSLDPDILEDVMARHHAQVLKPGTKMLEFRPAHTWTTHVLPAIFKKMDCTENGFYNHNGTAQQAFVVPGDADSSQIDLSFRNARAFIRWTHDFASNGTDTVCNIARYPKGIDGSALYRTMRMIDLTRYETLSRADKTDMFTQILDKEICNMRQQLQQQGGQPLPTLFN